MNIVDIKDLGSFAASVGLWLFGNVFTAGVLQDMAYFGSFFVGMMGGIHIMQKMYYQFKDRRDDKNDKVK